MKKYILITCLIIISCLILGQQSISSADTVYLKNGDKISGEILEESNDSIKIESEAIGLVSINRQFIDQVFNDKEIEKAELEKKKEKSWERHISLGYSKISGNTESSALNINLSTNRKTEKDEFSLKGDYSYASTNRKMDTQKWFAMLRYAYSFGRMKKWYHFYKLEADHDRFANIGYRIIPSTGLGYWFSDTDDWKAMLECGIGFGHTNYRDNTKDKNEAVLIPRVFFEKKLFGESRLSEDISLYPSLESIGEYRLHSETSFINPINEKLSLKFSLIEDYNSDPAKDTKKNDLSIISSLIYSF